MRATVDEVLVNSEVIVIGNKTEGFHEIESRLRRDQTVIDLVRLFEGRVTGGTYQGICW